MAGEGGKHRNHEGDNTSQEIPEVDVPQNPSVHCEKCRRVTTETSCICIPCQAAQGPAGPNR